MVKYVYNGTRKATNRPEISTCFALIAFELTVFIMLPEDLTHTTQLSRFRGALSALPLSLPCGLSVYSFINWSPDPEMLEDYGAE
jgi:hypothetical protein